MATVRYCDGCGAEIDDDEVLAQRPVPVPGGRKVPGPTRRFHRRCLPRAVGYLPVDPPGGARTGRRGTRPG